MGAMNSLLLMVWFCLVSSIPKTSSATLSSIAEAEISYHPEMSKPYHNQNSSLLQELRLSTPLQSIAKIIKAADQQTILSESASPSSSPTYGVGPYALMKFKISQDFNSPVSASTFLNDKATISGFQQVVQEIFDVTGYYSNSVTHAYTTVTTSLRQPQTLTSTAITIDYTITYITYDTTSASVIARSTRRNVTSVYRNSNVYTKFNDLFVSVGTTISSDTIKSMTYTSTKLVVVPNADVTFHGDSGSASSIPIFYIIGGAILVALVLLVVPFIIYNRCCQDKTVQHGYVYANTGKTD